MNNFSLHLSAVFFLVACSGQEQDSKSIPKDSSAASVSVVESKMVAKKDSTLPSSISGQDIPNTCTYKGDFKEAWAWYDLNGQNILILSSKSQTEWNKEMEENSVSIELFAKQYVLKAGGEKPIVLWELYDLVKDCSFDITADFVLSPLLTDLNNDKIKESFIVYKLACRSDVSPARLKIVMHDNKNKCALRGNMYISTSQDTSDFSNWEPDLSKIKKEEDDYMASWGRYESAKDFATAPPAFLDYANQLWVENFVERF